MTLANIPYLSKNAGPEWLPVAAAQGRQFAYWGQLALLFMSAVLLVAGTYNVMSGGYSMGAYTIIAGAVNMLLYTMMPSTVFSPLDQGRFREASDRLLIWGVVGLLFGAVGGLVLLAAYVKLQDVFQPQYQQYPPGQYYEQPLYQQPQYQPAPPPYQAPAQVDDEAVPADIEEPEAESEPVPAPEPPRKAEMTKCKNCGVQYPSFMRNCPNCGAPRS